MAEVTQGALFGPEKVRRTRRGNAFRPRAAKKYRIVAIHEHQQVFDFNSFMLSRLNLGLEGLFAGNMIPIVASRATTGRTIGSGHDSSEFFGGVQ